jgi:hypothetical protein
LALDIVLTAPRAVRPFIVLSLAEARLTGETVSKLALSFY